MHLRRPERGRRGDDEGGFTLIEIVAATFVMMVVLVVLTNLLTDSMASAVASRQRQNAALIAGDAVENAKALGAAALQGQSSTASCTSATNPRVATTGATYAACYTTALDGTTFTVTPTICSAGGSTGGSGSSACPASVPTGEVVIVISVAWTGHSLNTTTTLQSQVSS